ncbi:uncharacterized protein LOC124691003 [Lolium rigidum]|uniref:uncharacterized protein LOC124691003 n=1 Tax=Lolium rigidum TaxID=89674 RepID=UPI001F5C742D|nr:uncharacterized protein LOC124691003 [Lolium rigidum]
MVRPPPAISSGRGGQAGVQQFEGKQMHGGVGSGGLGANISSTLALPPPSHPLSASRRALARGRQRCLACCYSLYMIQIDLFNVVFLKVRCHGRRMRESMGANHVRCRTEAMPQWVCMTLIQCLRTIEHDQEEIQNVPSRVF